MASGEIKFHSPVCQDDGEHLLKVLYPYPVTDVIKCLYDIFLCLAGKQHREQQGTVSEHEREQQFVCMDRTNDRVHFYDRDIWVFLHVFLECLIIPAFYHFLFCIRNTRSYGGFPHLIGYLPWEVDIPCGIMVIIKSSFVSSSHS